MAGDALAAAWHGRRVLVTGGAGFLGSNLIHALAALGARVTSIDAALADGGANPANLAASSMVRRSASIATSPWPSPPPVAADASASAVTGTKIAM